MEREGHAVYRCSWLSRAVSVRMRDEGLKVENRVRSRGVSEAAQAHRKIYMTIAQREMYIPLFLQAGKKLYFLVLADLDSLVGATAGRARQHQL